MVRAVDQVIDVQRGKLRFRFLELLAEVAPVALNLCVDELFLFPVVVLFEALLRLHERTVLLLDHQHVACVIDDDEVDLTEIRVLWPHGAPMDAVVDEIVVGEFVPERNQGLEFIVGFDALAVYLHPDNPISKMSIEQLAQIYGEGGKFEKWADLGVEVPGCSSGEIVRVSRQNNSGTYAYFKEAVLGKETEYKLGSRDMHGSKDVVDLVANTPCAIIVVVVTIREGTLAPS